MKDKRHFSSFLRDSNSAFIKGQEDDQKPMEVAFILLEHFSMMAFTAAVDTLVTANLVRATPQFNFSTFGLSSKSVISDLSINIHTKGTLDELQISNSGSYHLIIICGGYRCNFTESPALSAKLKAASKLNITLGGLWNGAIALAQAGLLNQHKCAIHPDNQAFMLEHFPHVKISKQPLVIENQRATSAGPSSALKMMLALVEQHKGANVSRAIQEILSCDQMAHVEDSELAINTENPTFPQSLRNILELMNSNIEEPLNINELAYHASISRRAIERLFQQYLETTPSKYYLELRITNARRLLVQSNNTIANIAVACGFLSAPHFSHCFKDYFGLSPSQVRQTFSN